MEFLPGPNLPSKSKVARGFVLDDGMEKRLVARRERNGRGR
jgi:hypothetical protein